MSRETPERTLSRREASVVLDLEWSGQRTLRLADLRTMLGASDTYARQVAHSLVRKGWLERLRPGLYRLVPADRGRDGVPDSNNLGAGAALVDPYFFSFGTACTHHGLTEQTFAEVYIASARPRPPQIVRGTRFVVVAVGPEQFFGFVPTNVLGESVQMATKERALLDALDRPRHAGGIAEVSRMVLRAGSVVSWDALLELLRRWDESALVQRLGYFLDLHHVRVPHDLRDHLRALVRPGSKVFAGARRTWGTAGKLVPPWNVIANVPLEALVEPGVSPRRKVSLGKTERSRDR